MKRIFEKAVVFLCLQFLFLAIGIAIFLIGPEEKTEDDRKTKEALIFLIGCQIMIVISLLVRFVFAVTNIYWLLALDALLAVALALLAFKMIIAARRYKRTNNRSA